MACLASPLCESKENYAGCSQQEEKDKDAYSTRSSEGIVLQK